jgi:hypothetical protein
VLAGRPARGVDDHPHARRRLGQRAHLLERGEQIAQQHVVHALQRQLPERVHVGVRAASADYERRVGCAAQELLEPERRLALHVCVARPELHEGGRAVARQQQRADAHVQRAAQHVRRLEAAGPRHATRRRAGGEYGPRASALLNARMSARKTAESV